MKLVPRRWMPLLVLAAALGLPGEARAQDPCPSASGADAEAGWAAYSANDMGEARARFEHARQALGQGDRIRAAEEAREARRLLVRAMEMASSLASLPLLVK